MTQPGTTHSLIPHLEVRYVTTPSEARPRPNCHPSHPAGGRVPAFFRVAGRGKTKSELASSLFKKPAAARARHYRHAMRSLLFGGPNSGVFKNAQPVRFSNSLLCDLGALCGKSASAGMLATEDTELTEGANPKAHSLCAFQNLRSTARLALPATPSAGRKSGRAAAGGRLFFSPSSHPDETVRRGYSWPRPCGACVTRCPGWRRPSPGAGLSFSAHLSVPSVISVADLATEGTEAAEATQTAKAHA
jgi:hypothetical protein